MSTLFLVLGEELIDFFRDACLEATQFLGLRMRKNESQGMQPKTTDGFYFRTIFGVADYWMPDILHVYTDLVFPACFKIDLEQGKVFIAFQRLIMGDSLLTHFRVLRRVDDKGLAFVQIGSDCTAFPFDLTFYGSDIGAFLDGGEPCFLNSMLNLLIFGKEKKT